MKQNKTVLFAQLFTQLYSKLYEMNRSDILDAFVENNYSNLASHFLKQLSV